MSIQHLPDLPSDLIELALKDLEAVENKPDTYQVNMAIWHSPRNPKNICMVCFGGVVMAETLKMCPHTLVLIGAFDGDTKEKLMALDYFKGGHIARGLKMMKITGGKGSTNQHPIAFYSDDPARFKADMQAIADTLRSEGL